MILPNEEEIQKSKVYYKFIPEYELNEFGDVVNNNKNSVDNLLLIEEKKNEKEIVGITKINESNDFLLNVDNNTNQLNNNNNNNNNQLDNNNNNLNELMIKNNI